MTATGRESIRAARPSLAWKTVTLEVVAVALLAGVVRISSYHVPLERNTAQTLYGADVLLHGGTPYVDAAVNKGPLAYPMFAVIRLIVGRSEVAVRLSLLVFAGQQEIPQIVGDHR